MKVSVIIPVYNAERFVREAVRSVLQHEVVSEVLLVEDGSKDESLAVCKGLAAEFPRVRLVQHPDGGNHGASASRNLGIRSAASPFVAFLDADDLFLPDRFDREKELFAADPALDGVYGATGVHIHDAQAKGLFEGRFSSTLTTLRVAVPPEDLFDAFMGLSGILDLGHFSLIALTVRKTGLDRMNGLFNESLAMSEDGEFIYRLAYYTRLAPGSIAAPVSLRGVHVANRITRDPDEDRSKRNMFKVLLEWAGNSALPDRYRKKLALDVAYYSLRCANTPEEEREAIRLVREAPGVLKRIDALEAASSIIFGRDSLLDRAARSVLRGLFRLVWLFRSGAPPVARSRISPVR
ncbi:MAG: glycosyltransferase [Flavobacteriales bacterium]